MREKRELLGVPEGHQGGRLECMLCRVLAAHINHLYELSRTLLEEIQAHEEL